jgi:membrane protease YdiL (CAAX protease family)
MQALFNTILIALLIFLFAVFAVGLPILAHLGRRNRFAEISLIVILLAISFFALVLGSLGALVGWSGATVPELSVPPGAFAGFGLVVAIAGLAGIALCVPPLRRVFRHGHASLSRGVTSGGSEDFTNGEHSGREHPQETRSGIRWSDPPTFYALWLLVVVLANNVSNLLAFVLAPNAFGSVFSSTGRLSPFTVLVNQLPLVIVAVFGVGLGVQRNFRQTLARLGYGPLTLPQLGVVALFVVGAILLSLVSDYLFSILQPDLYEEVGRVSGGLFGTEGLGLGSVILFALLIGLGAGIGEETLIRGAVQPALGITLASVLWASLHVEYGPSILLIYIFLLSIALGILRRRVNTTATFVAHSCYNASLVLLSYFLGT